jgi:hypothetical protein
MGARRDFLSAFVRVFVHNRKWHIVQEKEIHSHAIPAGRPETDDHKATKTRRAQSSPHDAFAARKHRRPTARRRLLDRSRTLKRMGRGNGVNLEVKCR